MTKFARTIPKLTFLVLLLAALAAPTYASIAYTSCASGCSYHQRNLYQLAIRNWLGRPYLFDVAQHFHGWQSL